MAKVVNRASDIIQLKDLKGWGICRSDRMV